MKCKVRNYHLNVVCDKIDDTPNINIYYDEIMFLTDNCEFNHLLARMISKPITKDNLLGWEYAINNMIEKYYINGNLLTTIEFENIKKIDSLQAEKIYKNSIILYESLNFDLY